MTHRDRDVGVQFATGFNRRPGDVDRADAWSAAVIGKPELRPGRTDIPNKLADGVGVGGHHGLLRRGVRIIVDHALGGAV